MKERNGKQSMSNESELKKLEKRLRGWYQEKEDNKNGMAKYADRCIKVLNHDIRAGNVLG